MAKIDINPNLEKPKTVLNSFQNESVSLDTQIRLRELENEKLRLELELAKSQSTVVSSDTKTSNIESTTVDKIGVKKRGGLFRRKIKEVTTPKEKIDYNSDLLLKENEFRSFNVKRCPVCKSKTYRSKVFFENNKNCQIIKCRNKYCVYVERIEW